MEDRYIRVMLDDKATIIKFESSLDDRAGCNNMEVIGKNWLDMFVVDKDVNDVKTVFKDIFNHSNNWVSYETDIKCKNGKHKRINFHNKLVESDGIRYLDCLGVEHFENKTISSIFSKVYP